MGFREILQERLRRKPSGKRLFELSMIVLLVCPLLAQVPSRPHLYGIAHVAIHSGNLDRSRAFYEKFLGFEEPFTLKRSDGGEGIAFIKVNDEQYLEISPDTLHAGHEFDHFAFYTDDAAGMASFLSSRGVAVLGKVHRGNIGNDFFSVRDPDGHLIEIVQYQPDSWTGLDRGAHTRPTRISNHIMQVGIRVGAASPTLKFYTKILGLEEASRKGPIDTPDSITLRMPDGRDSIELLLYRNVPPAAQPGMQERIYLERSDLAKAIAELRARNAFNAFLYPNGPPFATNDMRQAALYDPDGTLISIAAPPPPEGRPFPASALAAR
jgi:catechol 2,3-dioxygenase-like lactoylglutathione lyase family enzyme